MDRCSLLTLEFAATQVSAGNLVILSKRAEARTQVARLLCRERREHSSSF